MKKKILLPAAFLCIVSSIFIFVAYDKIKEESYREPANMPPTQYFQQSSQHQAPKSERSAQSSEPMTESSEPMAESSVAMPETPSRISGTEAANQSVPQDNSAGQTANRNTSADQSAPQDIPDDRISYADGFYYEPLSDSVKKKITGVSYHENDTISYDDLRYVSVLYMDFEGNTQVGELICNRSIAQDLVEIFKSLYDASYPIDKIRLIDAYDGDDDLSCADNNSSCFNYRVVGGTETLSKHAFGLAVDINPFQNPYITYPNGIERISPAGSEPYADRTSGLPHMITEDDLCYKLFTEHGFTWGGHWKSIKDYQHFQKEPD